MTDVTSTPPALRWVAIFLAACAVLGLFLGFRDQIRKNPPGWYTGAEQIATPLATPADGAREATPFDPAATAPRVSVPAPSAATSTPAAKAPETTTSEPSADPASVTAPGQKTVAPAVPTSAPKPKAVTSAPKAAPSGDPVGDILESQKQTAPPATVPY